MCKDEERDAFFHVLIDKSHSVSPQIGIIQQTGELIIKERGANMKIKKMVTAWFALAAIFVWGSSIGPVSAYEVHVTNNAGETMKVSVMTRTDYSWDVGPLPVLDTIQPIEKGKGFTFKTAQDPRVCPSYLYGFNNDLSKGIVIKGCDGTENNMSSRCCTDLRFEIYKNKFDGKFHFLRK
jgi:hypothetical protein